MIRACGIAVDEKTRDAILFEMAGAEAMAEVPGLSTSHEIDWLESNHLW